MPRHPHILLVDDYAPVRAYLETALRRFVPDATITVVGCRADALAAVRALPIDLLIVEALLSDGSGLGLTQELRQTHVAFPIIVTATTQRLTAAAAVAGADRFLLKPFGLMELREATGALLTPPRLELPAGARVAAWAGW